MLQKYKKPILITSVLINLITRFFHLYSTAPFYGDIGWFYISARDAMVYGQIPVLGITSSVTWLHQGPLWTYLLIPGLYISNFHPGAGIILTSFFSLLTIIPLYYLASIFWNKKTGLISAIVYLASPISIIYSRTAFHTAIIPFFTSMTFLLFIRKKYLTGAIFLGFLYQLELSTVVFWPFVLIILWRQKYLFRIFHILAFWISILPFLLSGPIQVFGPFSWVISKILLNSGSGYISYSFYVNLLNKVMIPIFPFVSLGLILCTFIFMFRKFHLQNWFLLLPVMGIIFSRTSSEAYFTMLLIPLIIEISRFINNINFKFIPILLLILSIFSFSSLDTSVYGLSLSTRQKLSEKTPYFIKVYGPGDKFPSVSTPYEYLNWYQSGQKAPTSESLTLHIDEYRGESWVIK